MLNGSSGVLSLKMSRSRQETLIFFQSSNMQQEALSFFFFSLLERARLGFPSGGSFLTRFSLLLLDLPPPTHRSTAGRRDIHNHHEVRSSWAGGVCVCVRPDTDTILQSVSYWYPSLCILTGRSSRAPRGSGRSSSDVRRLEGWCEEGGGRSPVVENGKGGIRGNNRAVDPWVRSIRI